MFSKTKPSRRQERENRALCAEVKEMFGVSGLHFFTAYWWDGTIYCSLSSQNTILYRLIIDPDVLFNVLDEFNTVSKECKLYFLDDPFECRSLEELREYLLIKKLAGI